MINEIYVNDCLVINEIPKKQFKNGYKIKCVECEKLLERKWFENKILKVKYKCKNCVLTNDNPMYNEKVKEKHDKIIKSISYRENMKKLTSGEKNGFYGKTHNEITIQKIKNKNKFYNENLTEEQIKKRAVRCSSIQIKLLKNNPKDYRLKRVKAARQSHKSQFKNKTMNKIETKVFEYIKSIDSSVEFSVILASYQFDFGVKSKKILIEVDGDYWHGNPKFYNLEGSHNKRKLNEIQINKINGDKLKSDWAISRGFTIIRIWEEEINNGTYIEKLKNI